MYTKFISFIVSFILITTFAFADDIVSEEKFKAFGNCGMCQKRIERSLKIKEVTSAKWDKKTKIVTVAFSNNDVTIDSLQKRVASVGHDTEKFTAPDSVYNELPGCCLYRN